jgi:hypothetical protein
MGKEKRCAHQEQFPYEPSTIEPRLLFLRRDLVSATFSSARRFIETPNMRYELQIAENEAMIIEASYVQVCDTKPYRCHIVD